MTTLEFRSRGPDGPPLTMVTCYDAWTARIIEDTSIDSILVGDSVAMVVHGHDSTVPATLDMMSLHVSAVRRGAPGKLVVADFPFLAHRRGMRAAVDAADALLKAGAQAVKIEGWRGHEDVIRGLVEAGVPVMGHLGLLPQSVHQLGGFRVQAREEAAAERLVADARGLEQAGVFGLVLEAIPAEVAGIVTRTLTIPTIGIGAGPDTTGQVLVLQDLLGMNPGFRPRFVRRYLEGHDLVRDALERFASDVREQRFPAAEESYACSTSSTA